MPMERVRIQARPHLADARMILAFSGWMDGGDVSTGTIEYLVNRLDAQPLAEIQSDDFYLSSFPGSMEVSALFRPHAKVVDGRVTELHLPGNTFFHNEAHHLVLFVGKEPHLRWREYAAALFAVARTFDVRHMYFIGSVGGAVPHTREPRLFCTVSDATTREQMEVHGVKPIDYEGPASIATFLCATAEPNGLHMANMVAEIPAYIQGRNFKCIEAVVRKLSAILNLSLELDDLRAMSDELENKINEGVGEQPELAKLIAKLESDYDNEVFDTQMSDLKDWLEKKGIRVD